jgi:toxin secretion/phage lysis holin
MEMVKKGENMLTTLLYGFDLSKFIANPLNLILSFIAFDIVTGLLASAKQRKLSSKVNFNGMIKKIAELLGMMFFTLCDAYFKSNGKIVALGTSIIVGYEVLSIVENFDRIGFNINFISKYFQQSNGKDENK